MLLHCPNAFIYKSRYNTGKTLPDVIAYGIFSVVMVSVLLFSLVARIRVEVEGKKYPSIWVVRAYQMALILKLRQAVSLCSTLYR